MIFKVIPKIPATPFGRKNTALNALLRKAQKVLTLRVLELELAERTSQDRQQLHCFCYILQFPNSTINAFIPHQVT